MFFFGWAMRCSLNLFSRLLLLSSLQNPDCVTSIIYPGAPSLLGRKGIHSLHDDYFYIADYSLWAKCCCSKINVPSLISRFDRHRGSPF